MEPMNVLLKSLFFWNKEGMILRVSLVVLLSVTFLVLSMGNALAQDDPEQPEEPEHPWVELPDDGWMEGGIDEVMGIDIREHGPIEHYQRRPLSITVWKGISPWGMNHENVINHIVIGLSRDEMARLEGLGVATVSSIAYEHVYGAQYGTFAAISGGNVVGFQMSLAGSVAGASMTGAQVGGLGAVAGSDARLLQISGLGSVAGRDAYAAQFGGFGAVAGRDLVGLQIAGLGAVTGRDVWGAQAGGFAAVAGDNTKGLQIGGLAAVTGRNLTGFQFGGMAAIAGRDAHMFQFGGLAAVAGREMQGIQVSGLASISSMEGYGVGISGLATVAGENFTGFQFAGLANVTAERLIGAQVGSINFASLQQGVQVGLVNAAEEQRGVQIGLTNDTFDNYGLMIGFSYHIQGEAKGIYLGAMNHIDGEPRAVELGYIGEKAIEFNYITGTRNLRSVFSLRSSSLGGDVAWYMIGAGFGTQQAIVPERLDLEGLAIWYKVNDDDIWTDTFNWMGTGRLNAIVHLNETWALYGGATYNIYTSKLNDGSDLEVIALDDSVDGQHYLRSWISYQAGVRIKFKEIRFWDWVY
jgi:hypothetical protein